MADKNLDSHHTVAQDSWRNRPISSNRYDRNRLFCQQAVKFVISWEFMGEISQ